MSSSKPPVPTSSRPSAETVKQLAEAAKIQKRMWDTFAPERGIRFGDQRFWLLLGFITSLHLYNNYRDSLKPAELDLPAGAARRLPDGRLLMTDGSISAKGAEADPKHAPTLHKDPMEGKYKGAINNMRRAV